MNKRGASDLDAKLSRITGRIADRKAQVRALMAQEPGLLELADLLRDQFGAKLAYLRIGSVEHGTDLDSVPCSPPMPLDLMKRRRKRK